MFKLLKKNPSGKTDAESFSKVMAKTVKHSKGNMQ